MISPRHFFLLCAPVALGAAVSPGALIAAPSAHIGRAVIIRQRIDALLKIRTDPAPLAAEPPNPFYLASDVAPPPLAAARVDLRRPLTDAELLPRLAAGLRLGGVMELGDAKPRVIINQRPYREGDILSISYQEQSVKVLIKALDAERLLLGLNDAELSVRLKKPR